MITVKYPEWVEAQLKILDERIEEIYRQYADLKFKPQEAMRIKRNLYEQTKPFVDEKVRLISNCCPKYMVDGSPLMKGESCISCIYQGKPGMEPYPCNCCVNHSKYEPKGE